MRRKDPAYLRHSLRVRKAEAAAASRPGLNSSPLLPEPRRLCSVASESETVAPPAAANWRAFSLRSSSNSRASLTTSSRAWVVIQS